MSFSLENIIISDTYNNVIRMIKQDRLTISGNKYILDPPGNSGLATYSSFAYPTRISIDSRDNLYMADFYNNMIRFVENVYPTMNPTSQPSVPTYQPTKNFPTESPSHLPTNPWCNGPTKKPTLHPIYLSTIYPSIHSINKPTFNPTKIPSNAETDSPLPSNKATKQNYWSD